MPAAAAVIAKRCSISAACSYTDGMDTGRFEDAGRFKSAAELPPAPAARRARKAAIVRELAARGHREPLPRWVLEHSKDKARVAFAAGAAMLALDQIFRSAPIWFGASRMQQALAAATAAAKMLRLNADEASLRDAEHLTRPGDDPGPAGRVYRLLRGFAGRSLKSAAVMLDGIASEIAGAKAAGEVIALLEADLDIARRLSWPNVILLHLPVIFDPMLRQGGEARRPRADESEWPGLRDAVLARAAIGMHSRAVETERRAENLAKAAAALRTRHGENGLARILGDESVAPWRMLGENGLGSDRAARRFCETLHAMGALRLLTLRPSFRLYGL